MYLYITIHTCTHTNYLSYFQSIREKKPVASLKKQYRRCTHAYTHLLRANTDYSLFLLSKELHIANPPFTNHRTSALLNLVMLSHLTSHAN